MAVPYTFGTATAAIPLSQLDSNFATAITIGNTAVQLGNTVTTLNNMTLANVTISSGTITITNVAVTTANVSGTANISTLVVTANASVAGNVTVTGNTVVTGNVTSATHILTGGTVNGVVYLDSTKVLTTGSALVFDGSNFGVGVTPNAWYSTYKALQIASQGAISSDTVSNGALEITNNSYRNSAATPTYINSYAATLYTQYRGEHRWYNAASGTAGNAISFTQAMTLTAAGNLLVGTTSASAKNYTVQTANAVGLGAENQVGSFTSTVIQTGVYGTAAGTGFRHIECLGSGAQTVFQVLGNGNAQNTNNSYGAVSDVKLKENIVDATPKLAGLMQVQVRNYNMIGDTTKQIGVVAQELEAVFPAMVDETTDRDKEGNDLGTTTKSVKYSVFVPMLIKAIQEQQALITQLQADVAALKGA